ncbi:MAG: HD-GYP domain-containing protein [Spirochaetales bacterium]|nr:HD-GYP domain-containing protein [Spirochaetales bacterium]
MITEDFKPFEKTFSIHDVMEIIVIILNTRDPYTYEHSWRVSALSEAIISNMQIDEKWKEIIHLAAHLHDVGKIGVADMILNKPDKLTNSEFEKMKDHSEIGFKIVNSIPQLSEIALYVRYHHERWDGRGYPCGLAGADIPFGARVIAVADTFDAISSDRPYKTGKSYEEAFSEIERVRGTQLCPEIVDVFLNMKDEIPGILAEVNKEIAQKIII